MIRKIITLSSLCLMGLWMVLGSMNVFFVRPIPALIAVQELFPQEGRLSISLKPLSEAESEQYLNTDLLHLGYKPIQITIENQSADHYLIDKSSISLPGVDAKEIAEATRRSSLPASIGLKVAGFIFWPFSIPSGMYGIKTLQNHQKLQKDLWVKSVKEELIPPYTTMNRVFFVKTEEFKDSFYVTLINQETLESKVFAIALLKKEGSSTLDPIDLPQENHYLTHEE